MPTSGPHEVAFAIRGPITHADLPGLCDRVCALLRTSGDVVACDVASVDPDAVTVDALARLQLAARRLGCEVRLQNASAALLEVVELMGLTHVLAERTPRPQGVFGSQTLGFGRASAGNPPAMTDFTLKNLGDVEDMAVQGGFSESQEARFPGTDLGLDTLGVSYQIVKPGKHHAFGHRHEQAVEVYIVLSGSGVFHLDDDEVEVERLDAIRVGPKVTRGFEAGSDGLELLVFGERMPGDAEIVEAFFDE